MKKLLRNTDCFDALQTFSLKTCNLAGISNEKAAWCFVHQIEESKRRERYINLLCRRGVDSSTTDPASQAFDPIKCAIFHLQSGLIEDACWMIFLATYFGRHRSLKWQLCAEVYRGEDGIVWNWDRVRQEFDEFSAWTTRYGTLANSTRNTLGFGNHRKYESIKRTASAVESYINWVQKSGTHEQLLAYSKTTAHPTGVAFDALYRRLACVISFGRMARFDYLLLLIRIGLLDDKPTSLYLSGATGPLQGGRLLVSGQIDSDLSPLDLDQILIRLGESLDVGCDVLEDAICNWQKSPRKFVPFRG